MARLTITVTSGSPAVLSSLEEAVAVLTPALATLVADGASPTQAHVTAVNGAWTTIATILGANFVVYYDRATLTSQQLVSNAFAAARAAAQNVS